MKKKTAKTALYWYRMKSDRTRGPYQADVLDIRKFFMKYRPCLAMMYVDLNDEDETRCLWLSKVGRWFVEEDFFPVKYLGIDTY